MSAPYTPGPMRVVRLADEDGLAFLVVADNGCPLARLEHTAEDAGNAALFAAASELLTAARRARDALATLLDLPAQAVREHPAYAALESAIAKATGSGS